MLVVMKARKWLMNDILELECILKRERYPSIYKFGWLMIIIIILFLYVINTYKYQSYYITKGIVKDNFIELLVPINDLKYVTDNKQIILDGKKYSYNVNEISKDIYVDDKYNNTGMQLPNDIQDNCCYESDSYKAWYKKWCKEIQERKPIECKK